jgi:photosystem II stability/assembly factor-like uncharacterized protein
MIPSPAASRSVKSLIGALALALPGVAPFVAAAEPPPSKPAASAQAVDKALLQGLVWRSIGPYRGGRVTAVTGVPSQPDTYYFGGTGGGVWKTTDGGFNWEPITDGQVGTGSVGAVAVAESDPNVVYVGMGESPIRGNVSHGDGVYKSLDAGKSWKHVGLADTMQVARIRIHPRDPNLVYVAALGHTFGHNAERGVFRSKDGGASWQKVLFVDDKTGAIDLAMDPTNPRVLYAGLWQVIRRPWTLESGGPGSSLHKSTDGGDTWTRLTGEGLPSKGVWGKIGVTVSPANPNRVWALIEAEDGGVYRSDDAGRTWRKMNEERRLRQRAWYYTRIYADPRNADAVYVLNTGFYRSLDGGRSFTPIRVPHGDNHDLWIAPDDPARMIESNDGGANVSRNGGGTWTTQANQPTAQFYHVIADDRFPYHVYGAQQDNSTVAIASRTRDAGIAATDWYDVGGCESGYIAPKPGNPDVVFAGCYGGYLSRYDHRTGAVRNVTVWPDNPMGHGAEGMRYRFQWTFPIVISPHDPNVLYAAGNVLFQSTDEGQSWQAISPDLTRNDPGKLGPSGGPITKDNTSVEYYCTIFAFAESKLEKGLLWAGSDDGLVHVSRDGGKSWSNVTPKQMAEWSMVSQVEPSPHDAGTLYLAVNRYKLDDYKPYAYVTKDYGKTWRSIVNGIPDGAFVRVVREDPARKGLLYAGTETGVYVSFDDGANWQPLQLNLPVVPITDLVLKDHDLVASTQGRSFWILDDVTPLHQIDREVQSAEAHLFEPRAAYRFQSSPGFLAPQHVGKNPPNGAIVYYHLRQAPGEKEELSLEFLDASGKLVKKITNLQEEEEPPSFLAELGITPPPTRLTPKAGLNRFAWNLRHQDASKFKGMILWAGNVNGPLVSPGRYQVRLAVGGKSQTRSFEVKKDPRLAATQADLDRQLALLLKIRDKLTETHDAISRIREVREQVKAVAERARTAGEGKAVQDAAAALTRKLTAVEEALYQTQNQSNQDPLNFPIRLNNKLASLAGAVASADAAPTRQSEEVYADLSGRIDAELARLRETLASDVPAFNALVKEHAVPAIVVKEPAAK